MTGMEVGFDSLIFFRFDCLILLLRVPIWAHTDRLCQYDADYSADLRRVVRGLGRAFLYLSIYLSA